eukprot:979945-Amphidinium_carterae.1
MACAHDLEAPPLLMEVYPELKNETAKGRGAVSTASDAARGSKRGAEAAEEQEHARGSKRGADKVVSSPGPAAVATAPEAQRRGKNGGLALQG